MDAELEHHVEALTDDLIRAGQPPQEAARRARIALGTALTHKEGMRASVGLRWVDELGSDLRYASRMLRKSPGFTAIAVVSLALAIGANTTVFSIARELLYEKLHVPHAEQLRLLGWHDDGHSPVRGMWGDFTLGMPTTIFSYPVYEQLRANNQVLEDLLAFKEDGMNATIRGEAQRVNAAMVSGNYFSVLEVQPQIGRAILPGDDSAGAHVAMISDVIWQREFGRSSDVLGQSISVNQIAFNVIGVAPRGFTGAKGVMEIPDVFVPLTLQPVLDPKGKKSLITDPDTWWVSVMGRIKPGVEDRTAQAALAVRLEAAVRGTLTVGKDQTIPRFALLNGSRGLHVDEEDFKGPMYTLLAVTGLVILLACANIANLLLARGAQRQREMSVRLAMGAGRSRILRQLLTESVLLAAMGGALGLVIGYLGRNVLPTLLMNAWDRQQINTPFDWGVFALTAVVTLATGILFGLAPAVLASRTELSGTLKDTAQQTTRRRKGLTGRSIVAFQIALSTLLVIGAGLFMRTLLALNAVDVGFNADHLLLFEINPPSARYGPGKDVRLDELLEQRFAGLPGVEAVSLSSYPYIANSLSNTYFVPEGESAEKEHRQVEDVNVVGSSFFETMKIPMVAGRSFGAQDTETSPKVAIINQALAKKRFPGVDPVGKRFRTDDEKAGWIQIVGICKDTRLSNLREQPPAQFFMPYVQQPEAGSMVFEIRSGTGIAEFAPVLRRVVQSVDPDLPVIDLRTQRQQISATMQMERAFAALTAGFGVLALALACVGIYGIMAYSVAQRTNEIGIRLALGAQPVQVRSMILRDSTWLTLAGIAAGVGGALAWTRLVKSMLYGVTANDPTTITAGMALLLAVALAATWIPARRAASVEPMEALRHE